MADRSVGIGIKRQKDKNVTYQNTSNVYSVKSSKKPARSSLDNALVDVKPEKRGRKKAGSDGKSNTKYKTTGQKAKGRSATKKTRAKKGGK